MPRTPHERLYDLAHTIHRQAVQEYLSDHGQPVDKWHSGVASRAMNIVMGLENTVEDGGLAYDSSDWPDWSTVDLDGGEAGDPKNKPIYPIRLLGATGISLLSLHTLEHDNPWPENRDYRKPD